LLTPSGFTDLGAMFEGLRERPTHG